VAVPLIRTVEEWELAIPGDKKRHPYMPQPVPPFLVTAPSAKFRLRVARHKGEVIGSVEQKTIR